MDNKEHKLNVLQSIISRMANNSSNCKLWCITLTSAIFIFYLGQDKPAVSNSIIYLPLIPFLFLDAFYLGLEKKYIKEYNDVFTGEIGGNETIKRSVWYEQFVNTIKSLLSFSVWGFYVLIGLILLFIVKA